jgi:hypothetical protein
MAPELDGFALGRVGIAWMHGFIDSLSESRRDRDRLDEILRFGIRNEDERDYMDSYRHGMAVARSFERRA